eukprot:6207606-Pleurochrysis_carterae.AAC.1
MQRSIAGVCKDHDINKPIIRGPEIREEVHKIATKINVAETLDIRTAKNVLRWVGIGGGEAKRKNRAGKIERISTKESSKTALGIFQQHKGLGTDEFDGYLIRNATQELQGMYHEVIKDIVVREDYPTECNEWIAVLMMKAGEDPFVLGRRRDIWLYNATA